MNRFLCVHGHFYQPPRENPWLGTIEKQESAAPYHDWNERITAECYEPNASPRVTDAEGKVREFPSNYSRISFNFGPTLLEWLEQKAPRLYDAILAADRESRGRFSGHGSALAQAYNHMILPLANRRDKETQVLWGIRDFEHRFSRSPEGMWLPETAVDLETLEILAQHGIRFTILSPHQAFRVRPIGEDSWQEVLGGSIDGRTPYAVRLASGLSIAIFFYDGPLSHAVAFGALGRGGENLALELAAHFSERAAPQLVSIATDGETYGHHHHLGEGVLACALDAIEARGLARLTNYGEYLSEHSPTQEVEILENTAWSCVHGLGRWSEDCGCQTGKHPGSSQAWRAPLREALNALRDALAARYEARGREFFPDPWRARDDFLSILLDPSASSVEAFLRRHTTRALPDAEKEVALKLLEVERHAMLMFTSCGWFFDDVAGLETRQVLQYAGRAIQIAEEIFGESLEAPFLDRLEQAKGNGREWPDARSVYAEFVIPFVSSSTARLSSHLKR